MDISMLKEHLGAELFAQAEEKLGGIEGLRVIADHDGSWLPKSRLDEEISRRKDLQGAADSLGAELEKMKTQLAESEKWREDAQRLEKEMAALRWKSDARQALARAGARDAALVERLLEEQGESIEKQIQRLREESPYLFREESGRRAGFDGGRMDKSGSGAGHADVNIAIRAAAGRG